MRVRLVEDLHVLKGTSLDSDVDRDFFNPCGAVARPVGFSDNLAEDLIVASKRMIRVRHEERNGN